MPTGRVRRTLTPAALLLRTGGATALARARALAHRDVTAREALLDERLAAAATRAAESLGGMKGAVMKIGQLLSFVDTDLVPEQYRDALAALQADAPPMPREHVEAVVEAELGAPPGAIFDWFSPNPIAAASIGQVHLARIGDTELVVKVQYPGIADAVRVDLDNGALISAVVNTAQLVLRDLVPHFDARAAVEEIRERVGDELDYRVELANQQEFADLYRGHPSIHVPDLVPELSTARVLTMEYVDAMRYPAAVREPRERRDAWGTTIARFVFGSLYGHGLFNADPHPGNYLFHDDGRVTFLDFGCVKRFAPDRVALLRAQLDAVTAGDDDEILDAMLASGMLRTLEGVDRSVILAWVRRAYEPRLAPQPFTYTKAWAAQGIQDLLDVSMGEARRSLRKLGLPPDHVFLLRITAGLNSVLAGLEATVDWARLDTEILP